MPFLLHKADLLTEETAASDYQKWLDDDAVDVEDSGIATRSLQQRNEPLYDRCNASLRPETDS